MNIVITYDQLVCWAGRELTDEDIKQIEDAIPNSSIPEAISEIAYAITKD